MKVKENDYTCGTCKYWEYWCRTAEDDTCDDWTDPDEAEPTDDERRANAGCDECHRIRVEGREIE